jgi:hypothetical protein
MFKVVVLLRVEPVIAAMRVQVSCGSQVVQDAVHDADVDAKSLCQFGGPVGLLKQQHCGVYACDPADNLHALAFLWWCWSHIGGFNETLLRCLAWFPLAARQERPRLWIRR